MNLIDCMEWKPDEEANMPGKEEEEWKLKETQ